MASANAWRPGPHPIPRIMLPRGTGRRGMSKKTTLRAIQCSTMSRVDCHTPRCSNMAVQPSALTYASPVNDRISRIWKVPQLYFRDFLSHPPFSDIERSILAVIKVLSKRSKHVFSTRLGCSIVMVRHLLVSDRNPSMANVRFKIEAGKSIVDLLQRSFFKLPARCLSVRPLVVRSKKRIVHDCGQCVT